MLVPSPQRAGTYDLLVVVLGYEPRSARIAERYASVASTKWALAFNTPGRFAYDANEGQLRSQGFEVFGADHTNVLKALESFLSGRSLGETCRIGIDISSMSRHLLADTVLALNQLSSTFVLYCDFWYSPAKFNPSAEPSAAIESAGIVNPAFAGFAADPLDPVAAVIGVGYEPNLALGVAEYLDVSSVYAFVPYGHDEHFDRAVEAANGSLFEGDTPCRRAAYDITRPYDLYVRLESLVYGLSERSRVALVPLGPKIFSLCSFIVALQSENPVAVWRFSGGSNAATPTDSDGDPVRLSMRSTESNNVLE